MKRRIRFYNMASVLILLIVLCFVLQPFSSKGEEIDLLYSEEMDNPEEGEENAVEGIGEYIIEYYPDIDSYEPSIITTNGITGEKTKSFKISDLGFSKEGYIFEGWRVYRTMDKKWYLQDSNGKRGWYELENGMPPEGYSYALRTNGCIFTKPATEGTVRVFAQWGGISFEIVYYPDEESEPSDHTTTVVFGEQTPLLSIEQLGFSKEGKSFRGWKLYREIDAKWRVIDPDGKGVWRRLKKGKLEEGYKYKLFKDGYMISKATTSGVIRAYAQWE